MVFKVNDFIVDAFLFLLGFASNIVGCAILILIIVAVYKFVWKIVSEIWKSVHLKSYTYTMNRITNWQKKRKSKN